MATSPSPKKRFSSSTFALIGSGLLAIAAVGIALFRSGETADLPPAMAQPGTQQAGSMEEMITGLQERLRQDPDNHEGWFLLGMSYREGRHFAEAEQAFRRAMELAPQNADYTAYLGEALLLRGGDAPPPEAERLFRRALELQPGNPQARYYLATLRDHGGDHQGALDELIALLREAPADAPWEAQVREAATAIAAQNQIDISNRLPPQRAPQANATAAIPGPTREQMEAARTIPPSQQDAMVQGMVERLAARLRQNPRDAEGWIRLMRSRMVLNDPQAASEALRSGLAAFNGDAATQQRLRTAARDLGVPTG